MNATMILERNGFQVVECIMLVTPFLVIKKETNKVVQYCYSLCGAEDYISSLDTNKHPDNPF